MYMGLMMLDRYMGLMMLDKTEIKTAEPLVPVPNAFDVKMASEKPERHKSPGTDQIPAEIITARGKTICSEMHYLINSIWNKDELPEEWKEAITVPISKKGDKTDCSNYRDISLLSSTYKIYPTSCCQG
jgi:hypothetical protein